ncbi:DUF475 domain-containing protein [bacterium]|nr:DUF475 domain-containing protein [bacterium]
MFKIFGFSIFITITALIVALVYSGPAAAMTTLFLIAVEMAISFDNAIVNAKVLAKLSHFWQQIFLTVGILIAIFVVRFLLPIVIVMLTANLAFHDVINLALNDTAKYGEKLHDAHAAIAGFGGSFLLALSIYFLLDDERKVFWIKRIEKPLQKFGGTVWLPPVIVLSVVSIMALFAHSHAQEFLRAAIAGTLTYTLLKVILDFVERFAPSGKKTYTGWPALLGFLYLEVLDASFSFDGVLGAFAITNQVLLIALGLGVGAVWVRSFTIMMVRRGTLATYKYLDHGAHYAILILALALLLGVYVEIPDAVIGLSSIGVILFSFIASKHSNNKRLKSA